MGWLPIAGMIVGAASAKRTSGNITLNSTSWANVDTGLDLTFTGVRAGDIVEFNPNARVGAEAVNTFFDVATIVSGSPVNYFAGSGTGDVGVQAWRCVASAQTIIGAPYTYTVVAGDLSAGSLTLRFRYATESATNRTLVAATNQPLQVSAKVTRLS